MEGRRTKPPLVPEDTISSGAGLDVEHTQRKVSTKSSWGDGSPTHTEALQQTLLFSSLEEHRQEMCHAPQAGSHLPSHSRPEQRAWFGSEYFLIPPHRIKSAVWASPARQTISKWCYGCAISTAHLKSASSHTQRLQPRCWAHSCGSLTPRWVSWDLWASHPAGSSVWGIAAEGMREKPTHHEQIWSSS